MGKANPLKIKDKNKDKKKKKSSPKKESKSLIKLKPGSEKNANLNGKSLQSLNKIKQELKKIVAERKIEKQQFTALKSNSQTINEQLITIEKQFPPLALNKDLQLIKSDLLEKSEKFQTNSNKLSQEITLLKDLADRVERKIKTLENTVEPSRKLLENIDKDNQILLEKIHSFELELNQISTQPSQPDSAIADFSQQLEGLSQIISQANANHQAHDAQIQRLQTDTDQIRKSVTQVDSLDQKVASLIPTLNQVDEQNKQLKKDQDKSHEDFKHKVYQLEEAQQQLIAPLETHLNTLENEIQSIQQDYSNQQKTLIEDTEKMSELALRVTQFDEQLHQSQDELKQHIQLLSDSDNKNTDQLNQFNDKLTPISQQLEEVAEQSSNLQMLFFETLQEHQKTSSEHHDELSKQYLRQQQQIAKHDDQLLLLNPVIGKSEALEEQIDQLGSTLEQMASTQKELSGIDQVIQSNLNSLSNKLDDSHVSLQNNFTKVHKHQLTLQGHQKDIENHHRIFEDQQKDFNSQQQEQAINLSQLGERVNTRSQLFGVGLIAVLAISAWLFFNQDIWKKDPEQANLSAKVKSEITNEAFSKINTLTKQNGVIINQQLDQIRDSINQVSNRVDEVALEALAKTQVLNGQKQTAEVQTNLQSEIKTLQEAWQEQHQLLQNGLVTTQSEQQNLKENISQLSDNMKKVNQQLKESRIRAEKQAIKNQAAKSSAIQKKPSLNQEIVLIKDISQAFYTIQLTGALQKDSILQFLRKNNLSETSVLQTELEGKPWFILVYGNYSSFSQAREKLLQLPAFLQKNKPWVRKLP